MRRRHRQARSVATAALLLASCRVDPAAQLARAPRRAAGERAVELVPDPCATSGTLVAPVAVAGWPTWLLVDSGAYNHALLPSTVAAAGLTPRAEHVLVGRGAGRRAGLVDAALTVPGLPRLAHGMLVLDLPALLRCGEGGVFTPVQLVDTTTAVELDVPRRRLALVQPPRDLATTPPDGFLATFDGALYNADVTLAGTPARLLVDTGADRSWVLHDSAAGRALMPRARPVADGAIDIQDVRTTHRVQVELVAGALRRRIEVDLMPGAPEPGGVDGALGMPELRRCVLTFAVGRMVARCPASGQ